MEEVLYYLTIYGLYFIYGLILILLIKYLFNSLLKIYHSNWNHLINGFNFSSEEFYKRLKEELQSKGVKNISFRFVFLKEGSFFSRSRTYLRVEWKEYQYDICAAPFGKGFFISWWLLYKNSIWELIVSKIPFVGKWLVRMWFPITYYKVDTASMFMTYCHNTVLKVMEDITKGQGIRAIGEDQRKPILNNIFKR